MFKTGNLWTSDHVPFRDWGGLANPVHVAAPKDQEGFTSKYPWKDNAWFVFWDAEQGISAAIHCPTSFNGGQRFARAVLAYAGQVVSCDETPDVGRLSSTSIDLENVAQTVSYASAHK